MPGSKSNSKLNSRSRQQVYRAMAHLVAYTGLRVSELAALRWRDIREFSAEERIRARKSNARRSPLC